MTEGAFGLPLRVDFAFMVLCIAVGMGSTAHLVAGLAAAGYTLAALGMGILLGAGYEAKKQD